MDGGNDTADNVRQAFSGKRGKILMVGGAVAIAGYVWWTRRNGTPEALPADPTGTGTTGTAGSSPQTDPTVGNQTVPAGNTRPLDNESWLSRGVDVLVGRGVSGAGAYSALRKALDGAQLSTQEQAWVSQVITAIGSPPEGMPPLNATAPPPKPQQPPKPAPKPAPKPKPKPAPKPKPGTYTKVYVKHFPGPDSTLSQIAARFGKSWQTVWNDPKNAALRRKRGAPDHIRADDVVYVKH